MILTLNTVLKKALVASILLLFMASCKGGLSEDEEFRKIVRYLSLEPGLEIADLGAGDGDWAVRLARVVGIEGRVFATEVDDEKVSKIQERALNEGLTNIEVSKGSQERTGLPEGCCDAILIRLVYHHFEEPIPLIEDLSQALRQSGLVAVIDFPPTNSLSTANVPGFRDGHGVEPDVVITEMVSHGFTLVEQLRDWDSGESRFFLLFQKKDSPGF